MSCLQKLEMNVKEMIVMCRKKRLGVQQKKVGGEIWDNMQGPDKLRYHGNLKQTSNDRHQSHDQRLSSLCPGLHRMNSSFFDLAYGFSSFCQKSCTLYNRPGFGKVQAKAVKHRSIREHPIFLMCLQGFVLCQGNMSKRSMLTSAR